MTIEEIEVEIRVHKDHASVVRMDGKPFAEDRDELRGVFLMRDLRVYLVEMK